VSTPLTPRPCSRLQSQHLVVQRHDDAAVLDLAALPTFAEAPSGFRFEA